jgi:hypothetical protein
MCRLADAHSLPDLMLSLHERGVGFALSLRSANNGEGGMRRRTLYLPALIMAAAVLMDCAAVLAVLERAEATFPDKSGRIAYSAFYFDGGVDETIYTIKPGGEAKLASVLKNSSMPPWSSDQGLKDPFPAVFWPWFGSVGFAFDLLTSQMATFSTG